LSRAKNGAKLETLLHEIIATLAPVSAGAFLIR
jgi:hypothetical protein